MSPAETEERQKGSCGQQATKDERKAGSYGDCGAKADPRKPPNKKLPACRVCEGPGAGLHYGVNTCDPCKAFFRRTLTSTRAPKCSSREGTTGMCPISNTIKNPCSFCRQKKCQDVGMSKSAIRLGRYSLAKKTKDTIELKGVEREIKPTNVVQLEDFINSVMAAHKTTLEYMYDQPGYENIEEMKKQVTDQLLQQSDDSAPLDPQTFLHLYRQGIEPDCRMRNLKDWAEYMALACKQFVSFLNNIPGFRTLPHEDKIALAKGSFLEVDMMNNAYITCDQANVVCIPLDGAYIPMFTDNILGKELAQLPTKLALKMKKLNLTPPELCSIKILCIFATERSCFKETKGIDSIRQVCLDSLFYEMRDYSGKERNRRFSKMVDILSYAAFVSHKIENFLRTTFIDFAKMEPMASAPEITKEMLGLLS